MVGSGSLNATCSTIYIDGIISLIKPNRFRNLCGACDPAANMLISTVAVWTRDKRVVL
jgi:hypothetical protein